MSDEFDKIIDQFDKDTQNCKVCKDELEVVIEEGISTTNIPYRRFGPCPNCQEPEPKSESAEA